MDASRGLAVEVRAGARVERWRRRLSPAVEERGPVAAISVGSDKIALSPLAGLFFLGCP